MPSAEAGTFVVAVLSREVGSVSVERGARGRARAHPDGDGGDDGALSGDVPTESSVVVVEYLVWDRRLDGGFPETKVLKRRVRDLVEPGKGLGHVDHGRGGEGGGGKKDDEGGGGDHEGDRCGDLCG